ncbi:MAG: hypothetical protein RIS21_1131 [Planctomycetota bacterium]
MTATVTPSTLLGPAADAIRRRVADRIVGLGDVTDLLLVSLFSGGHSLLVGVPGLAKTTLVRAVADALDLSFKRIQFTPDLLPSDITGAEGLVDDPETGERTLVFVKGPVFAHLLLADEINRTPPKTQAALLEAMEERSVTVGGVVHRLEAPFCVLATQNPIEQVGTYPLPTAQLDRFLFLVNIDYPARDDEARIVKMTVSPPRPDGSLPLVRRDDVLAAREAIHDQPAPAAVVAEAVRLARLTRPDGDVPDLVKRYVEYGASPRAAQQLVRAAKARAALRGVPAAEIADVRALAPHVFRHRLVMRPAAAVDGIGARDAVDAILKR